MKDRKDLLIELERKLSVEFKNIELLNTALTHSSYANQKKDVDYYERLEFLGDSVLQLCISEYLYLNNCNKTEGQLTKMRALIVCENSLHEIAKKWELGKYMRMSKGEELTGGRTRISILADCVESIIAALYLDGGIEKAKAFIFKNFIDTIERANKNEIVLDYKTKLQELIQQKGNSNIKYELISFEGPPHRRKFYTEVVIGDKVSGKGVGFTKKESEQSAAKEALITLEVAHE